MRQLVGHTKEVLSVAWLPDGRRLVSGGEDSDVIVWDAESGRALHHLEGHKGEVKYVASGVTGRLVVSAGGWNDGKIRIWDAESGQIMQTIISHPNMSCVAWSPDQQSLACSDGNCSIVVRDVKSGKIEQTLATTYYAIAWGPKGRIATAGYAPQILDAESGEAVCRLQGKPEIFSRIVCVLGDPTDGMLLVARRTS